SCTIKEALTTQNATSTLCGVSPDGSDRWFPRVYIPFLCAAGAAVMAHFFSRFLSNMRLWRDEMLNLLAMLGCAAHTILGLVSYHHGFGMNIWAIPFGDITFYVAWHLYVWSRFLIRSSIIVFLIRIFRVAKAERALLAALAANVVASTAFGLALLLQCQPMNYFWNQWDGEHEGKCANINAVLWAGAVLSIVLDLWTLALPPLYLFHMQLPLRQKFMAGVMLTVGICTVVVSFVRLTTVKAFGRTSNPTADTVAVCIANQAELAIAIICACLPAIHAFFKIGPGSLIRLRSSPQDPNLQLAQRGRDLHAEKSARQAMGIYVTTDIILTSVVREPGGMDQHHHPSSESELPLADVEIGELKGHSKRYQVQVW
ncbi:hypothetical protein QBC46DRAFT_426113, partial [Diplogelasinospora grovesii]